MKLQYRKQYRKIPRRGNRASEPFEELESFRHKKVPRSCNGREIGSVGIGERENKTNTDNQPIAPRQETDEMIVLIKEI
jgi:hypothetical protein